MSKKLLNAIVVLACTMITTSPVKAQTTNSESFDGTFLPAGWTKSNAGGGTVTWTKTAGTTTTPAGGTHTGSGTALYDSYNESTSNAYALLVTPSFDLRGRGSNTPTVSFWMYRDNNFTASIDKLDIYVNTTANLSGSPTLLGTVNRPYTSTPTATANTWNQYSYNIPVAYSGSTNYIIFKATSQWGADILVDDVTYISYPCSITAGTITATATTVCGGYATSASISGQSGGTTLQWQTSPDNATWTDVSGATSATYVTAALSSSPTYIKCNVTGSCTISTNVLTITVNSLVAGSVSGPTTVCSGSTAALTLTGATGSAYQWQSSPDNITWSNISGATSTAYTTSAISTTTYYRVVVTAPSPCPATTANSTPIAISPASGSLYTWKGTTSNAWATATNWCGGVVPSTSAHNVLIPSGTTNSPNITTSRTCGDITIDAGATLTVASGGTLNINGNLTNNGTLVSTAGTLNMNGTTKTIDGSGDYSSCNINLVGTSTTTLIRDVTAKNVTLANAANTLTLNGNLTCTALSIGASATVSLNSYSLLASTTLTQNGTINLNTGTLGYGGSGSPTLTAAKFYCNTGTMYFNATGSNQTVSSGITYYHLKINNNDGYNVNLNGAISCQDFTLVQGSGSSGTGYAYMNGALTINGNLTIGSGCTLHTGDNGSPIQTVYDVTLYGNFVNNGLYEAIINTFHFRGGNTTLSGTSSTYFFGMEINKTAATNYLQLNENIDVTQDFSGSYVGGTLQLVMTKGIIDLNGYRLNVLKGTTTDITGYSASSYINTSSAGILRRYTNSNSSYVFPVGNGNAYQEMTLNFTASHATYMDINFDNPANATGTGLPLSESGYSYSYILDNGGTAATTGNTNGGVWTATPDAGSPTYNITLKGLNYDNSSPPTGRNTVLKRNTTGPGAWTLPGTFSSSTTSSPITVVRNGITGFSQFAIGTSVAPLPISLISFNAIPFGEKVKLKWKTASETNNAMYIIERSQDGINFEIIGNVKGHGTSTTENTYSSIDESPLLGITYYRLRQTDFNGAYTYSEIKKVSLSLQSKLLITPNPVNTSYATLMVTASSNQDAIIRVYDEQGAMVYRSEDQVVQKGANNVQLNVGALKPGLYMVKITLNDAEQSARFIKE